MNPLTTIADTLRARAAARDPLAPAEMESLAATLESLATNQISLSPEWLDRQCGGNITSLAEARRRVVRERSL